MPIFWNMCYNWREVIKMATKAQREANARHIEKLDGIKIWVPKGQRQKYKDFAASQGYSLNALTVALWDAAIAGKITVLARTEDEAKNS